jgi:hypothetical protein
MHCVNALHLTSRSTDIVAVTGSAIRSVELSSLRLQDLVHKDFGPS